MLSANSLCNAKVIFAIQMVYYYNTVRCNNHLEHKTSMWLLFVFSWFLFKNTVMPNNTMTTYLLRFLYRSESFLFEFVPNLLCVSVPVFCPAFLSVTVWLIQIKTSQYNSKPVQKFKIMYLIKGKTNSVFGGIFIVWTKSILFCFNFMCTRCT